MPQSEGCLLHLVGALHAAAADPDRSGWQRALGRLGDALGGVGIGTVDHRMPGTVIDAVAAHLPPELVDYTIANLGSTTNPFVKSSPTFSIGVWLRSEMLIDPAEIERSELYNDVLSLTVS